MKKYTLRFNRPSEDSIFGWKNESLPISNAPIRLPLLLSERKRQRCYGNTFAGS